MYSAEFIGTFIFVFSILCITSIEGMSYMQTSISVGLALVISILATLGLSKDSKAHLNPAVSVAFFQKGSVNFGTLITLIVMQAVAALLAVVVFNFVKSSETTINTNLNNIIKSD